MIFLKKIFLPTLVTSKEVDNQEEEKKAKIREKARKAFARMNDYSFRIFSPCGKGAGWVLDYEIPKNGGCPTTWYMAANAHVLTKFRFSTNTSNIW
ncbi:hypothetical protein A6V39_00360 [Candidatus Mycoplasma haematobovis]|uniref:DUF31 domain-containing protein n=1 Tax=Candidatus Mycoplasma haematobovis TaxID=432608 RepID=A0A1A9QD38_9MOLU|nr:hypothetical protein [Candidatus Mycoplasma haematobovis]OAL10502.1 hypothetical protein A6V39_00360 [Candidatus Mycoplasma haematobovis]